MHKLILCICLLLPCLSRAQREVAQRPLEQLINTNKSSWPLLQGWIDSARNKVEVLPRDKSDAEKALFATQVTTSSILGSVIYETGGILVDHGWVRLLGSGSPQLDRTVMEWNRNKSWERSRQTPPFLLVADDAGGGFYALNYGGLADTSKGNIFYFAPDLAAWDDLKMNYPEFIYFLLFGDLEAFYKGLRWTGWKEEIATLNGNETYMFSPPLSDDEGVEINSLTRTKIPIDTLWSQTFHPDVPTLKK